MLAAELEVHKLEESKRDEVSAAVPLTRLCLCHVTDC